MASGHHIGQLGAEGCTCTCRSGLAVVVVGGRRSRLVDPSLPDGQRER